MGREWDGRKEFNPDFTSVPFLAGSRAGMGTILLPLLSHLFLNVTSVTPDSPPLASVLGWEARHRNRTVMGRRENSFLVPTHPMSMCIGSNL